VGIMKSATWEPKVQPAAVSTDYYIRIPGVHSTDKFKQNLENIPTFKASNFSLLYGPDIPT